MPQDINQETIEHLIRKIQASNYMYFTKDEIKYDDIRCSKPLYIIVRCKNILICKILIDNGSILNVLPRHILSEITVDESHMRPSTMMAMTYNGLPR